MMQHQPRTKQWMGHQLASHKVCVRVCMLGNSSSRQQQQRLQQDSCHCQPTLLLHSCCCTTSRGLDLQQP